MTIIKHLTLVFNPNDESIMLGYDYDADIGGMIYLCHITDGEAGTTQLYLGSMMTVDTDGTEKEVNIYAPANLYQKLLTFINREDDNNGL